MKFGDTLRGTVNALDEKGRGMFDFSLPHDPGETRRVIVPFSAPGDEIEATFIKRDGGTWIAKLKQFLVPSPERIPTPCPHAGTCGGCLWQHLAYDAQIQLKLQMINNALEKAGHPERLTHIQPSPELFYYRNRMDYVIGWKQEIGLKEYGSWNRYLDLQTCLLLDQETPKILQTVRELMRELHLEPWDAKKYTGLMRYVIIRLGKNTNERLITLLVHDLTRVDEAARQRITHELSPFCTSLYLGENPEITDLSNAKTLVRLHGKEYLTEEINGLRYDIHPNSFFQTNTHMAGELQKVVLDLVGTNSDVPDQSLQDKRMLDLYCGLGFFAIAAAKRGAMVVGVELDAPAIELAKHNAAQNGVTDKTAFLAAAVEKTLETLRDPHSPNTVILDPPRAGLHPKVIEALLERKPQTIVYVSCNYHRLTKELKKFKTAYQIESLTALDLFPQTPHVEVVAKLVLSSAHE